MCNVVRAINFALLFPVALYFTDPAHTETLLRMPGKSSVARLVVFSLAISCVLVWWIASPARHDPLWHVNVLPPKNRTALQATENAAVVSGAKQQAAPTKGPFDLVKGDDYFADYDIFNVSLPAPGEDYDDGKHSTWKFRYMNQTTSKYPFRWISSKPRVAFVPNFLTDEECDQMIAIASPRLERSQVVPFKDAKGGNVDEVRTSSQTWLDVTGGIGKQVADRILELVHFPPGSSEMMQILRYQTNQKYDAHNDYFDPKLYGPQATNRAVTAFLYLSTVEEGGYTWFPDADNKPHEAWDFKSCKRGLGYKPKKGNVVVFYDMTPSGDYDPSSLHGGCPVKKGVKWGGTLWMRVNTAS